MRRGWSKWPKMSEVVMKYKVGRLKKLYMLKNMFCSFSDSSFLLVRYRFRVTARGKQVRQHRLSPLWKPLPHLDNSLRGCDQHLLPAQYGDNWGQSLHIRQEIRAGACG